METEAETEVDPSGCPERRVAIVTDGRAGNENPALGLAEAVAARLGAAGRRVALDRHRIALRSPWDALPAEMWPLLGPQPFWTLQDAKTLTGASPADLVIGAGRRSAPFVLALKRRWGAKAVQWLDPRAMRGQFDLVIAPAHDAVHLRSPDAALLAVTGSLHRVTPSVLQATHPVIGALPAPKLGVLIGGPSKSASFDDKAADGLVALLDTLAQSGAGLAVTASRRTPDAFRDRLRDRITRAGGYYWDGTATEDGANPYHALLGQAQALIVTADSVNMVSEAAATGRPVWAYRLGPLGAKHERFLAAMAAGGHVQWLPDDAMPEALVSATTTPLNDMRIAAERVAALIR